MYLHVGTLEGENIYITVSTRGFYINRSTSVKFDPSPRPQGQDFLSCSLFDVMCGFSPLFLANFAKLFSDPVSQRDYFAAVPVTNSLAAHPWMARPHAHHADPLRSQTAYLLTGATSADTLEGTRDWNDELQSTRELPRTTLPERLMRDRVLNRVYAEFTLAAARAVPRVAAGEVQAMNPMDKPDAQMFISNNLFLSKGADGVDIYPHMGGDEAAHVAVSKDVQGIRTLNSLDIEGLCLLGTVVVDWKGERWVAQSIVPGLFRRRDDDELPAAQDAEGAAAGSEEEAKPAETAAPATNGSAAATTKPASGTDPLKPDPNDDTQVVYGGVEGPEVIRTDPAFHSLFGQIARTLHLSLHEVEDAKKVKHPLWLSVDSKGLRGADGRKYVLDLARLNPVDVQWLESDARGAIIDGDGSESKDGSEFAYPHRMVLLRPELLEIYWDHEFRKWARDQLAAKQQEADKTKALANGNAEQGDEEKEKAETEEKEPESIDSTEFKLSFNPDAFAEFKSPESEDENAAKSFTPITDESDPTVAAVRSAGKFLRETAIPRLVTDVAGGLFSAADGSALTRQMHARGINVRYLGYIAHLAHPSQKEKLDQDIIKKAGPGHEGFLKVIRSIAVQEMVLRASKRILRSLLKGIEYADVSACVSHFLNCLLGSSVESSPSPAYQPSQFANGPAPAWTGLTPESLAEQVRSEVKRRFRFELPRLYLETELRKAQLLREICLRNGIQLKLQDYRFEPTDAPIAAGLNGHAAQASEDSLGEGEGAKSGGKKKKKKGSSKKAEAAHKRERTTTFEPEDVLNLLPVVKDSTPKSTLAEEAFEAGRISISRGDRELGVELLLEGVSFYEQVYGVVHPEVARCYSLFATIIHHFASVVTVETAETVRQAQAEGDENAEIEVPAVDDHLSLANAVRYQRQAVTVSERTLGLDHPETLTQYMNLAVLERSEGNTEASLRCQKHILELWDIVYGNGHPDCVNAISNVALTLQNARQFDLSLKLYQSAHEMAVALFGAESIHTANLAHELSQAYTLTGELKSALNVEKEAWRVFEARLGKEDAQTRESEAFLSSLAASAVRLAKLEKEAKAREARRGGIGISANRPRASIGTDAAAAAATVAGSTSRTGAVSSSAATTAAQVSSLADRSLDDLVKYIQGGSSAPSPSRKGKSKASLKMKKTV